MTITQEQNPDTFIADYSDLILNITETENNFTTVFERWRHMLNIESEMDRQALGLNREETDLNDLIVNQRILDSILNFTETEYIKKEETEDPFEIDEENQYITRI